MNPLTKILATGTTLIALATASGCSNREITGEFQGVRNDGDGGGKVKIDGEFYGLGSINADTLKLGKEYTFRLTSYPLTGEYVNDVKPVK